MSSRSDGPGLHLASALIVLATLAVRETSGQAPQERFWLAGRYDRTQVIMYFDPVKFGSAGLPDDAVRLTRPIADAFFLPVAALSPDGVARVQKSRGARRFAVGDRYDLLLDGNRTIAVTLTRLVGFENDEGVGNDSYVGALARVAPGDIALLVNDYYAVRRRATPARGETAAQRGTQVSLNPQPVSRDITTRVRDLIRDRLQKDTASGLRQKAGNVSPEIERAQRFTIADGTARYYVSVRFGSNGVCRAAAFVSQDVRILAVDESYCLNDNEAPSLLNVLDLGRGRTAVIVNVWGGDGRALLLLDYRDGVSLLRLPILQSISSGE